MVCSTSRQKSRWRTKPDEYATVRIHNVQVAWTWFHYGLGSANGGE